MPGTVGLAGLGLLGRGIATCLLNHGFHVIALESSAKIKAQQPRSERLTLASTAADLAPCDFVIESISEDLAAKSALFCELERHIGADVPLVTNTSAIPISLLQANLKHPGRFAGMHWTTPAEFTRFLEIIRGDATTPETLARIEALALELDKEPGIVQKDLPGFVANRIAYAMYREALHLVNEGVADPQTIDVLCRHSIACGHPSADLFAGWISPAARHSTLPLWSESSPRSITQPKSRR